MGLEKHNINGTTILTGAREVFIELDNVNLLNLNFSGIEKKYNREGDRNFCVYIDDPEVAQFLIETGLNVKIKQPKDDDGEAKYFIQVKVKWSPKYPKFDPEIFLVTGPTIRELDEESVSELDRAHIINTDLDVRAVWTEKPNWSGWVAYLVRIEVTQAQNRFRARYESLYEDDEE